MKESVVSKLALRETRGTLQQHLRSNRVRFFKKCPQRFCLPLESILDVNGVIKKGHVILGFTKNGRYLISYCLKIDNDDSGPLPCYVYSLHWWEFNQQRPLVQVFSVTLFDKEEIHQDLHLMVAESQDESKFVVYGEIHSVKDDESHQCYVTVCAAPSPHPCPGCRYTSLGTITERCLKHSFVVNFKYELLPPFPIFNPSTSLKMEDTVLFNTGDFLMALKISTFDSENGQFLECFDVSKIRDHFTEPSCKVCPDVGDRGSISCQCSTEDANRCSPKDASEDNVCSCWKNRTCHLSNTSDSRIQGLSSDLSDGVVQAVAKTKYLDRQKIVSGFVNELNKIHGKQDMVIQEECQHLSPYEQTSSNNYCQEDHMGQNEACFTGKHASKCSEEIKQFDKIDGLGNLARDLSMSGSVENFKRVVDTSSQDKTETVSLQSTCSTVAEENSSSKAHSSTEHLSSSCVNSPESGMNVPDYTSDYDSELAKNVPNTRCSSCGCSGMVMPMLNNNNLTTSVIKVYSESSDDNVNDLSEDFDMYDGSLPITVKTCYGRHLKQIGKINKSNPNPASNQLLRENLDNRILLEQTLAVHQVTLDLEQCINELIQAHEGLRDRYKSLKDYDVQIVSVCPDSCVAIIMARILVYTRKRQRSASCGLPVSPSPILQCTGFLFSWDVCCGAVKILQVLDLENYPEQRKYTKFNMATKEASELRAKFFIPQSISSFVQAFSNHTVFTGKSLKYLRHPFLPLVLVL